MLGRCALLLSLLLLTACTSSAPQAPDRPTAAEGCQVLDTQTEQVLAPPTVAEVPEAQANVVLKLSSSSAQPRRITVRAGDVVLLDVRVPAAPAGCYLGGRVFVHSYRLPAQRVIVTATADEQRSSAALTPGEERQWLTVLPQDGSPLDAKVWTDESLFG